MNNPFHLLLSTNPKVIIIEMKVRNLVRGKLFLHVRHVRVLMTGLNLMKWPVSVITTFFFPTSSSSSSLFMFHPPLLQTSFWGFWGEHTDDIYFWGRGGAHHLMCLMYPLLQLRPHPALPLHTHQEAAPPCPRRGLRPHLLDTNAPCLTHPAHSLTVKGA